MTVNDIRPATNADFAKYSEQAAAEITAVKADIEAGTLAAHEWLILTAPGTAKQQLTLTAAIYLNRGMTADQLRGSQDDDPVGRLMARLMEHLGREMPGYVTEIGRILAGLEARWPEIGPGLCLTARSPSFAGTRAPDGDPRQPSLAQASAR